MNQDIKKLEEERAKLLQEDQAIQQRKNEIMLRLAEIQGVFKFLKEKEKEGK